MSLGPCFYFVYETRYINKAVLPCLMTPGPSTGYNPFTVKYHDTAAA